MVKSCLLSDDERIVIQMFLKGDAKHVAEDKKNILYLVLNRIRHGYVDVELVKRELALINEVIESYALEPHKEKKGV